LAQHLNRGESHANSKLLRLGLVIGVGFLVPQALAGAWYLWTLGGNVPTMFAAITGLFAQYSCFPGSDIHLSDLFAVKLVIVGYLFLAGLSLTVVGERPLSGRAVSVAVSTAVLSSAVVMLGETMQEYSHLPYLVTGKFTVSELLTATFPLSMTTASTLIAGFGIFFVMLFAILYVAYVKR
jgi:cytochrome bd-type quinol oxidase subunit 1